MTTTADLPGLPALVDGFVAHRRRHPVPHRFRHRSYQWLIDVAEPPQAPWYLAPMMGFRARDYLGGAHGGPDIRANVERFLAGHGVELGPEGRVVMLTNARVLGYLFNPLTVYWCFDGDGVARHIIAEVANTYGQRHAYLVQPDANGRTHTPKMLYVSPFNDVSGHYAMGFDLTPEQVRVSVSLRWDDLPAFDAEFRGRTRPATQPAVASVVLRRPLMTQKVWLAIRLHALWLWLRRVPVVRRPDSTPNDSAPSSSPTTGSPTIGSPTTGSGQPGATN